MYAIGVDIGGTKIAAGVVDEHGKILAQTRVSTEPDDASSIDRAISEVYRELSKEYEVGAIGLAAAGFVSPDRTSVLFAPNIAWRDYPIADRVAALIGTDVPIVVENDANAAGWAEFRFGAGRLVTDMTMLTIGTGVGGAIVTQGGLFRGGFGAGAELGHLRVVPDGLPCGCGARGCIEQYGSGRALLRMANGIADAGGIGLALAEARALNGELNGTIVGQLIAAGDPGAVNALQELGRWLGQACASLAAVLDPQVFVFGGGVSVAGDLLLDPIRESFLQHLPARGYHPEPGFVIAELVNDAGVVGAADLARIHAGQR